MLASYHHIYAGQDWAAEVEKGSLVLGNDGLLHEVNVDGRAHACTTAV